MAIDMTTVKQIMHNNKEVVKIEDGLGNILWQKQTERQITITYVMGVYINQTPASKTVTTTGGVYALTSSDLPTLNLATGYTTTGWTLDGSTTLTAGTTISDNVTLLAIQKVSISKTYDWSKQSGVDYIIPSGSSNTSGTLSQSTTHWNLKTSSSASATRSYKKTWSVTAGNRYYAAVSMRGFAGVIANIQVYKGRKFKIHWTPTVSSVTYARTNSYTIDGNYAATYPMILVRDGNTTTRLYYNNNVSANFVSDTITAGSSANSYLSFQYGGWNSSGNLQGSWARQNRLSSSNFSANVPTSNHTGNVTDNIYIYIQP